MNIIKKYPNTKQHDASDCAAAVISTVLLTYKHEATIMKIREIIGTDAYGTSVKGNAINAGTFCCWKSSLEFYE